MFEQWQEFIPGNWMQGIDVRDFIQPNTEEIFTKYRKTHNDGVFDACTRKM